MTGESKPVTLEDLQAYVDDELVPERRREVDAHLADNEDDAARVAAYRRQDQALRTALAEVGEEQIPETLIATLQDQRPPRRPLAWVPQAAAALIFLAIGGALGWGYGQLPVSGAQEQRFLEEALAMHRVFGNDRQYAVEMAGTDSDSLRTLLSAWLDAPIMAPDLKTAGLSLVGARLLANDHGPAALLVYETANGELVTCYITAEAKRLAPGKVYLEEAAAGSLAWPTKHHAYAITAGPGRERLVQIADAVNAELKQMPGW